MKYSAPFNTTTISSILGTGISAKVPFFVPTAGVTAGDKKFTFL